MADLNVSLILRLVDRATAPARAVMRMVDRMGGESMMRGAQRVREGMAIVTRSAGQAVGVLGDYRTMLAGLGFAAVGASFVREAAAFEKFNVQLTNLEGSAAAARTAMSWIEDFATRTPLQVEETVDAYARLKAFGIDPTNGSMQALVDTMAATGGGSEQLMGMVIALGQAQTKGKLQGEEAMQLLERGVPVYDLLARKLGKTTEEIVAMQAAGELGREEIALLIEAMAEANEGAAGDMAKTWDGIISNLWDYWSKFKRMVMASGVFDYLKGRLQTLLDTLNRMAANGDLQRWAESLAASVISGLEALWAFGAGVVRVWQAVSPWIIWAVDAVGGFSNAIGILIGMKFSGWLLGVAGGLAKIALAFGPVSWAMAGIAGLAYVIYDSWDGIVSYFTSKIDAVAAAFDTGLLNGVLKLLSEFNPFSLMYDAAEGLFTYITGWSFADARAAITSAFGFDPFTAIYNAASRFFEYVTGWSFADVTAAIVSAFNIDFYAIGVKMITDLWNGAKAIIGQMAADLQAKLNSIAPSWMTSSSAGGTAGIGGDSGYGGMGGAMDDSAAFAGPDGDRATGGPVRAGGIYRWQEEGEEFFSPRTDGSVINARGTRALRAGGGGTRMTTVNLGGITINAGPSQSPMAIARAVRAELERMTSQGFALHDGGAYNA
jgi:tape measure domain-containing protein